MPPPWRNSGQTRGNSEESRQQGRIRRVLYINGHYHEIKYIDPEKPRNHHDAGSPTPIPASAAAVKMALKAGTATPQLLQGEIARLRDRESRTCELDQEKIQKEIHTQFSGRLTDPTSPAALTPGDQLGIRLLIYQSLDYSGRDELHKQVPYEEGGRGRKRNTPHRLVGCLDGGASGPDDQDCYPSQGRSAAAR